jgi:hypothetical protein
LKQGEEEKMRFLFGGYSSINLNSKRFTPFLRGVEVMLPSGNVLNLKITRLRKARERQLFQLFRHTYFAEVSAGSICEIGCGDSDSEVLAAQKSISEAIERCLFRALKGTPMGTQTSNGWATHVSRPLAAKAALEELLERDAVLVHALKEIPFIEVEEGTFPVGLRQWVESELSMSGLSRLRVLVSTHGHVPSISVMLVNRKGYGVIAHAVGATLQIGLKRALGEACRLGRIALSGHYYESSAQLFSMENVVPFLGPSDQAVAYSYFKPFPSWMFGQKVRWLSLSSLWRQHCLKFKRNPIDHKYVEIMREPLSSGFCTSTQIQPLFFGRTCDADRRGELNKLRLNVLEGSQLSALPHFVA